MMQSQGYNKNRLKDYSLWYYFRYFPSNKKLISKLREKSSNKAIVDEVYSEIKHLLIEDEILETKIKNYIIKNKNLRYIRQKLREKLFETNSIEKYLEPYVSSGESLLIKHKTINKIEYFKNKGKSINYIKQKLIERIEDKGLVMTCINEVFGDDLDRKNLLKEYRKITKERVNLSREENKKIATKLINKGFNYHDIKKLSSY